MDRLRLIRWGFAMAGLIAVIAVSLALLLIFADPELSAVSADRVIAAIAIGVFGAGGAILALWIGVERRVLNPLEALGRDVETLVHTRPDRGVVGRPGTAVEPLARAIDRLALERDSKHTELVRALAAARESFEEEKAWLEAILRDLAEGVILCNGSHRVVLFNRAAERILGSHGELGLGRSLFEALGGGGLGEALNRQLTGASEGTPVVVEATSADGAQALTLRVAPVIDAKGRREGYVVTYGEPGAGTEETGALPPRPVFYDFSLLRPTAGPPVAQDAPLRSLTFVVFDTETTGLEPAKGDEIIQIGAVRIAGGKVLSDDVFDSLVNPGRKIPQKSIRFHGITDEMVRDAPGIDEILPAFRRFVGDAVLVGQNAAFDLAFLNGKPAWESVNNPVLDTMLLSIELFGAEGNHTLDGLAERFGVEISGRHTALGDSLVTAEVFLNQVSLLEARGEDALSSVLGASQKAARKIGALNAR